jgi:hypothetical protein
MVKSAPLRERSSNQRSMLKKALLLAQGHFYLKLNRNFISYIKSASESTTLHLFLLTRWTSQTRVHLD